MKRYEYAILQHHARFNPLENRGRFIYDPHGKEAKPLLEILNGLGHQGWHVVGVGGVGPLDRESFLLERELPA